MLGALVVQFRVGEGVNAHKLDDIFAQLGLPQDGELLLQLLFQDRLGRRGRLRGRGGGLTWEPRSAAAGREPALRLWAAGAGAGGVDVPRVNSKISKMMMSIPAPTNTPMSQDGMPAGGTLAGAASGAGAAASGAGPKASSAAWAPFRGASHSWQNSWRGETRTPHWGQKVSPCSGCSKKLPHVLQ